MNKCVKKYRRYFFPMPLLTNFANINSKIMAKKVFISYSWGNKEHQDWIVNLGTRLMNDTVDVVLDRWSLKDGHDIFSFMEEMVKSDDIFRVLIICDENYRNKANERTGGVGTETQIITPEIYSNQKQEKFIVIERDSDNKPYLPIYLSSRKYIDFSNEEYFENSYEELLRNILEAPAIPKPKLGTTPPLYITENKTNNSEVNSLLRTLDNQIKKYPEKINQYSSHFLELFSDNLWGFDVNCVSRNLIEYGDMLYDNLLNYKILRDDFISYLLIVTNIDVKLDVDDLIDFFGNKPMYLLPKDTTGSWNDTQFEIYKIIFQELFIYTIAVCLKNKNYSLIADLLLSHYYKKDKYNRDNETKRFTFLYSYHENFENYLSQKYNKVSGFGYYIISNLNEKITKEQIVLADLLCYIIGELYKQQDYYDRWFPNCYIYKPSRHFDFFDKLESKRYFEKIKEIFDVDTPEELSSLLVKYKNEDEKRERFRFSRSFEYIPFVYELIDMDKIATNR